MSTTLRLAAVAALAVAFVAAADRRLSASGPVGLYGLIEKVVFEPNEAAPARVQVWGAFAYVDGQPSGTGAVSPVRRGFLYFRLPDDERLVAMVKREWADLKSVAGTGQAVGFGTWGYIGAFGGLDPARQSGGVPYILEMYPGRGVQTDMRVRPASEAPASPAVYQMDSGVVKIPASGSRADLVRQLQDALRAK